MEDPALADAGDSQFTLRLRLEPIGPTNAADLWLVHNDDEVAPWYGNDKPSLEEATRRATLMGDSWRFHGVHKWIAYDRVSGEVVGRGGLSRTPVDDDWGQIYAFLPEEPWVRVAHECHRPFIAHAVTTHLVQVATAGIQGLPWWRARSAASGDCPCLRAVER